MPVFVITGDDGEKLSSCSSVMSEDAILSGDGLLATVAVVSIACDPGCTDGDILCRCRCCAVFSIFCTSFWESGARACAPDSVRSALVVPVDVLVVIFEGEIVMVPTLVVSGS